MFHNIYSQLHPVGPLIPKYFISILGGRRLSNEMAEVLDSKKKKKIELQIHYYVHFRNNARISLPAMCSIVLPPLFYKDGFGIK